MLYVSSTLVFITSLSIVRVHGVIVPIIYCLVFFLLQKRAARLLLAADYSQLSVTFFSKLKWLPIFDLIKLRKFVLLLTILNNPDATLSLQLKFNFLSSVRSTGLRTRACAFNLQVTYPRSNSGKRTIGYSAATLFNCRDSDLKQIACVSPSSIIYSSRLNNFKHHHLILKN